MLGSSWAVFIVFTVVLFGGVAGMSASALARTWRPFWLIAPLGLLLATIDRLLGSALFQQPAFSASGYLLAAAALLIIMAAVFRATLAHRMVVQYPWLYRKAGPFAWRERT